MAKQVIKKQVVIEFAVKGTKKAEGELVALDAGIATLAKHVKDSFTGLTFKTFNNQLATMREDVIKSFDKMLKAREAYEAAVRSNSSSASEKKVLLETYQAQLKVANALKADLKNLENTSKYTTVAMVRDMENYRKALGAVSKNALEPFKDRVKEVHNAFVSGAVNVSALKELNTVLDGTRKRIESIDKSRLNFKELIDVPKGLSKKIRQSITDVKALAASGADFNVVDAALAKVNKSIKDVATQTSASMRSAKADLNDFAAKLKEAGSTTFNRQVGGARQSFTKGTADPQKVKALTAAMKDNLAAYDKLALAEQKQLLVSKATTGQAYAYRQSLLALRSTVESGAGVKEINTLLAKSDEEFKKLSSSVSTGTEKMAADFFDVYEEIKHLDTAGVKKLAGSIDELKSRLASGTADKGFLGVVRKQLTDAQIEIRKFDTETSRMAKHFRELYKSMNEQVNSLKQQLSKRANFATNEAMEKARAELIKYEAELKNYDTLQRKAANATNLSEKELKEYIAALTVGQQRLEKFKDSVRATKSALSDSRSKMKGFRNALGTIGLYGGATAVVFKLVEGVKALIGAMAVYDKSMRTLAAVTGMTLRESTMLQDSIVDLGIAYGKTNEELATVALELARAGTATEDLNQATEITIKLAALTGDTVESSTKAVVSYTTVFKSAELTVGQLGDRLAYMANQSRLSTQDINTFSNYALTAAKSVGLTVDQVSGLAIALSNAGNNASTIGTQIRRFATTLTDTDRSVKGFFQSIGVSQAQLSSDIANGTDGTLREFVTKLANFTTEEFAVATADLNILTKQAFQGMRNNAAAIKTHISGSIKDTAGELEKAELVTQSLENRLQSLKNTALQVGPALEAVGDASLRLTQRFLYGIESIYTGIGAIFTRGTSTALDALATQGELNDLISEGADALAREDADEVARIDARIKIVKKELSFYKDLIVAKKKAASLIKNIGIGADSTVSPEAQGILRRYESDLVGMRFQVKQVSADYIKLLNLGDNAGASKLRALFSYGSGDTAKFLKLTSKNLLGMGDSLKATTKDLQEFKYVMTQAKNTTLEANANQTAKAFTILTQQTDNFINNVIRMTNSGVAAGESLDSFGASIERSYLLLSRVRSGITDSAASMINSSQKIIGSQKAEALAFINNAKTLGQVTTKMTELEARRDALASKDKLSKAQADEKASIENLIRVYKDWTTSMARVFAHEKALAALTEKGTGTIDERAAAIRKLLNDTLKYAQEADNIFAAADREKHFTAGPINLAEVLARAELAAKKLNDELGKIGSSDSAATGLQAVLDRTRQQTSGPKGSTRTDESIAARLELLKKLDAEGKLAADSAHKDELTRLKAYEKARKDTANATLKSAKAVNKIISIRKKLILQTKKLATASKDETNKQADYALQEDRLSSTLEGPAKGLQDAEYKLTTSSNAVVVAQDAVAQALANTGLSAEDAAEAIDYYNTVVENGFGDDFTSDEKAQYDLLITYQKKATSNAKTSLDLAKAKKAEERAILDLMRAQNTAAAASIGIERKTANRVGNDSGRDSFYTQQEEFDSDLDIDATQSKYDNRLRIQTEYRAQLLADRRQSMMDTLHIDEAEANRRIEIETQSKADQAGEAITRANAANAGGVTGDVAGAIFGYQDKTDAIDNRAALQTDAAIAESETLLEIHKGNAEKEIEIKQQLEDKKTQIQTEAEEDRLTALVTSSADAAAATLSSIGGTINNFNEAFGNQSKGAFETAKALNLAAATISMFSGAVNAYTSASALPVVGMALAPIAAAAALAAGAANIAKIKNQKFEPKKYHSGGMVTRADAMAAQSGNLRPDEVPATLQTGEYVMSRSEVAQQQAPIVNVDQTPQETVIINTTDDSVMESYMESRSGRNVINNIVNRSR